MKAIHWFYLGAGIDILALLIAVIFILKDMSSASGGTNNPIMYKTLIIMTGWIGIAFWLKSIGKLIFANVLLWIPGTLIVGYGLLMLLFVIFKPDMR